ncbi:MAG: type II toxin-antitoxin system PemK/MazF family toxin [Actinobacteria bacterium]|nr:type II toxin-antitoxin system PemK/MazF family toxin [Actinomycetota bacterium]
MVTDADGDIRRGQVYSASLRDCAGVAGKVSRPVLVIQNDIGNRYGDSVIVACVTADTSGREFPVMVEIPRGSAPGLGAVCLNQLMTIEKYSLGEILGTLSAETMAAVDEALRISLGLPRDG